MKNTPLNWINGYEQWNLVRIHTPPDGHCLFHALCMAFFIPYQTGVLNNKPITQLQIIQNLRQELALKLSQPANNKGQRYYDLLHHGHTAEFASHVPEYTLEHMMNQLNSNHQIGYGYIEYIADQLNKDIYILNGLTHDIYVSDEAKLSIKGRNSIVLYYIGHHYELVGLKQGDDLITHFLPSHNFILFLKSKC
jgi:hypothetical protein